MSDAADPYGDSIAHVQRNLAACRELGVKFGPGYVAQAFQNIDKVWTLAVRVAVPKAAP